MIKILVLKFERVSGLVLTSSETRNTKGFYVWFNRFVSNSKDLEFSLTHLFETRNPKGFLGLTLSEIRKGFEFGFNPSFLKLDRVSENPTGFQVWF